MATTLIIIRLHPDKSIAGGEFADYLSGLTITAYDLSVGDPKMGTKVGEAGYLPPPNPANPWIPDPSTGIVQHFTPLQIQPPRPPQPESVATAVIEVSVPAGYKEYVSPDLRITITRTGSAISEKNFYYDVEIASVGALPPANSFPSLTPTSLYLKLPRPVAPGIVSLDLNDDGSPPNFKTLKDAVTAVLSADQPATPPAALGSLTPDQARHIAYEIVWGPQDPFPDLPGAAANGFDDLGALYTSPPNSNEQLRQQFEGDLTSYYATHNANIDRLTRYILALSAAITCEELSKNAKTAFLQFPVNPAASGQQTTISTAEVILVDGTGGNGPLVPAFEVPAEYFYVLGAQLPPDMGVDQRFLQVTRGKQERLLPILSAAYDDGTINPVPAVNPAQAVRRLNALQPVSETLAPHCKLDASILPLANDWLAFPANTPVANPEWRAYKPGDDPFKFWTPEVAAQPLPYLHLVLCALTNGYQPLINAILALPITSVTALAVLTEIQWKDLFGAQPNVALLPPFTAPGTPESRVQAFIRRVQKFFDMASGTSTLPSAAASPPPTLDLPTVDIIGQFVTQYEALIGGAFSFGSGPLNEPDIAAAVQQVFPGDPPAQSWLNQRVHVINELCFLAGVVSGGTPPALSPAFSIAEALYARGFTSADVIKPLSLADFSDALRGTVAFSQAAAIYARAGAVGPPPPPAPGSFTPVNPGSLVNCIPPCYLSPLGPVEYLHELLQLSEASTCKNPFALPPAGKKTLGDAMAERRGSLGNLAVTAANAETQIPLIDIVNENLENLAAILPAPPVGITYDTTGDKLANHVLCPPDTEESLTCHKPTKLFEALPEHSSPAIPVAQPSAYDKLKLDFSAPTLPYSQPLDIARTYLDHFGTCRFETMRTFRKEITEFALDPTLPAPVFQSHLWRYPVRIDIAIEYLQLNPEEYELLFTKDIMDIPTPGHLVLYELYGFDVPNPGGVDWINIVLLLPEFLKRTGLSYCELVELQKSECFKFIVIPTEIRNREGEDGREFILPDCEPCCLEHYHIEFIDPQDQKEALRKLAVFLRLWRKLQEVCGARYTFTQLCDICEVLQLFNGPAINPDFIRQLVAFQILRDQLCLKLTDGTTTPGAHGADRTHILALWVGLAATKWLWAVGHLLDRLQHFAKIRHECCHRPPHFIKLLASNLDSLSILAGFDPAAPSDTWHARPANTLRFAEILAKIYASSFGIGEVLYLFTADDHLDGDDPFPLQPPNESLDSPLGLPDDDRDHSLWVLRKELLSVEVTEDELHEWTWHRIDSALRHEFGYDASSGTDYLLSFGQHFFPAILEHAGITVAPQDRQYRVSLAASSPDMWNIPPNSPFRYDAATNHLWTQLPLRDEMVVEKLEHLRQLNAAEQLAVQSLYYMPRVDIAPFACFFPSFAAAEKHLIEERDEKDRWHWFRRQFVIAYQRCHIIARHLASHVEATTESEWEHAHATAWLVLKHLFADENRAASIWEADSGVMPDLTWKPLPSGGAFAALLGLTGTGLLGEFTHTTGSLAWREVRGPMDAFGHERNEVNAPVPTVLPAMDLVLTPEQSKFIELRNGFAIQDQHGRELGSAESFTVKWSGVLLVEEEGQYEFIAGAPRPDGEEPDIERVEYCRWRVTLTRGQKTWILLNHHWPGEHGLIESCLPLKCGAYGIVVEFVQPPPDFTEVDDLFPQYTGFQVKYSGPDTGCQLETLPLKRLYRDLKDETLDIGILFPEHSTAGLFLKLQYTSSLRDIRRTYQRAFKALLFAHRFELSGHSLMPFRQSELGYLFDHSDLFAGMSYFRNPGFTRHAVDFNFNFWPLLDTYHPLLPIQDQRVQPSAKRKQALFDWWERIFDYAHMRRERQRAIERPVWLLFEEALEKQPDNPAHLLRHLDVDLRHAGLVLSYFQSMALPVFKVTFVELEDDRWAVRAWHGDRWVCRLVRHFAALDIRIARSDLWASDDPGSMVTGETDTGNTNLSQFLCDGCFENGEPRRYTDVKQLNDCLREHARSALLAYLCGMNRIPLPWGGTAKSPKDLSALLLLDIETGLCERSSRIEEAVTAVQTFIQRARLGLEAGWPITADFVQLWKHEFELFRIWEKCKCRALYKENWIEWDELREARKVEAFQFLESELRRSTLTIAVPGGLEYWPETLPPPHPAVKLLQKRDKSALRPLTPPREGLSILGTPERDGRPSWLASDFRQERDQPPNPENPAGIVLSAAAFDNTDKLPFWIQAAIKLGTKFIRVAAAGMPPAEAAFHPSDFHKEPNCCNECGCAHPPLVDEYYFWLIGSQVFNAVDQDEYYDPNLQVSVRWHDEQSLSTLLDWKSAPAARLAWCRVHNGEFKQPRRSDEVVQLLPGSASDLDYVGRVSDSLTFSVNGGIVPVGYNGTEAPGFRYDMATDCCISLPLVEDPVAVASPYPAGLPAYPYFAFVEPGDRLFPKSLFSPSVSIAAILRCHCRFEPALKWYQLVLNPILADNSWVHCSPDRPTQPPDHPNDTPPVLTIANDVAPGRVSIPPPEMCCDSTNISAETAKNRAILLLYLETLVEWSHALMRQNSRESAQQARLVLDTAATVLGPCPRTSMNHETTPDQTVAAFKPLNPPLNSRLMELYCHVRDGLALVHRCLTNARLRNTAKDCRSPYWRQTPCDCGSSQHYCGCGTREEPCCDEAGWCHPHSPYRFVFLVQKAQEAAARVRELGNELLSAFDRGDAEYLASMRARHEAQLADMTIKVRQDQWRESDWQIKALGKTKEVSQTNRRYYKNLIDLDLNFGEQGYKDNTMTSVHFRSNATDSELIGEGMRQIPDLFIGFPASLTWETLGTKLGGAFETYARYLNETAEIASINGSLDLTEGGWQRRLDEWVHQVEILDIEIEQIEIQILGAERRRNQSLEELNIQQRQLEQSREMLDALRDKFTSHELYLYLQKETTALYWKMYELARHLVLEAQRVLNFELGFSKRNFLGCEDWDNLHEGLMAGERLQLALQRMENEYVNCNRREYELTKHLSLALHFPFQFLRLKITGCCEIECPEWMFDMDYAGQYMRRIKNVSLTIPCVTGPYTGVHCRLTLLRSQTRIDPCLPCPETQCCDDKPIAPCGCRHESREHYDAGSSDSRIVRHYGAQEAIATSSGRNDSGLFELNFRDERHLPFEFYGAVSCWRIELPPENNYFDMDSLTDVILHMNYTAREGGDALRDAARNSVKGKLPGNGWIFIDVRKDFPDVWELFRRARNGNEQHRESSMTVNVTRKLFPYLPADPSLKITKLAILFETSDCCEHSCPDIHQCPCIHKDIRGSHLVEVTVDHQDYDRDDTDEVEITCMRDADWPNLYHGVSEVEIGPIDGCHECHSLTLTFESHLCDLDRAFLLCRYEVVEKCCETMRHDKQKSLAC
ncbi:MAG: insecticidal toxin complex protein [Proteobacteria bacterium]|nr:insecticidal toxin complex protein [Pseudomonadota bacterium]